MKLTIKVMGQRSEARSTERGRMRLKNGKPNVEHKASKNLKTVKARIKNLKIQKKIDADVGVSWRGIWMTGGPPTMVNGLTLQQSKLSSLISSFSLDSPINTPANLPRELGRCPNWICIGADDDLSQPSGVRDSISKSVRKMWGIVTRSRWPEIPVMYGDDQRWPGTRIVSSR